MLLLLLACVAPPPVAPSEATLAALEGEPMEILEYAAVRDEFVPSLSDGGPPLVEDGYPFWSGRGRTPVVETGNDVRLLVIRNGLRLLVWMPREGLADLVARSVWVGADGERVEGDTPGVRVPGGLPVDVREDGSFVEYHGRMASAELRVSDGFVDQAARPDDADDLAELDVDGDLPILAGAVLEDDDGTPLITFRDDEDEETAVAFGRVLRRAPGRALVEVRLDPNPCRREPWLVRGWVPEPEAPIHRFSLSSVGFCCGGLLLGDGATAGTRELPPGTRLFDAAEGALVGVTEDTVAFFSVEDGGGMPGWTWVELATPWGRAPFWVEGDLESYRME
jgi:hypothetical protein